MQIANSASSRISKLEKNKTRENLVIAKPGLVENKINNSFVTSQEKLSCVSGNIDLCKNQ